MSEKLNMWYVYFVDAGEVFFVKRPERRSKVYDVTSSVQEANKFYDIISAETFIKWAKEGYYTFNDVTVEPELLKIAYKNDDGIICDKRTGDELNVTFTESTKVKSALKLLSKVGYSIKKI